MVNAMEVYTTEEERLDAFKAWWKENGRAVIVGIVIGMGLLFAWQAWEQNRTAKTAEASDLYSKILEDIAGGRYSQAASGAEQLIEKMPATPYAQFAALAAAKANVMQDKTDKAKENLQWTIDHAGLEDVRHMARLRLVSLHIADQALDKAEAVLKLEYPQAYKLQVSELRGDILVARGDQAGAKKIYAEVLNAETLSAEARELVQLKRDELGYSVEDQAAASNKATAAKAESPAESAK